MPGKGYRVDTDFKLRPDRRKKRAKAALVALAIIVLLEGYLFLHYLSWLGKTGEPPGIVAFMTSMGALFTFFPTVPLFSADTWRALGRMYLAGLPDGVDPWLFPAFHQAPGSLPRRRVWLCPVGKRGGATRIFQPRSYDPCGRGALC